MLVVGIYSPPIICCWRVIMGGNPALLFDNLKYAVTGSLHMEQDKIYQLPG